MTAPRNLILITADAWRADYVDQAFGVPLLASLDRVRSRTARFERCYTNAPWTTPGLLSVFTGQTPLAHGIHHEWDVPEPGTQALAQLLRDAGRSVPNICYLNRVPNYANLGYEASETPEDADPARLLDAIRDTPEPFFLWFHYKDTHLPYWAAEPFRRAMGIDDASVPGRLRDTVCSDFIAPRHLVSMDPADRDLLRRLYAAGVLELDAWLAQVWDRLEATGLAERSNVVLTSDHGEELLDHGFVGHASTAYHAVLFEELLRIPLLVVGPDVDGPRWVRERVQGLDLFPTLLSLAGVAPPTCEGVDLTGALKGQALPRDRVFGFHSARMGNRTGREHAGQAVAAVSDGRHKLIVERYDAERWFGFDLSVDPLEQSPVPDGPVFDDLRRALSELEIARG